VIADPVVRNRGTIGGSLCQADPAEDLSAVCTALDATCVLRGLDGERELTMEEFHRGPYETACGPAEMLVEVRIPRRPHGSSAYAKVERRAGDWAVASAGVAVWLDGDVIADVLVGLAAVGPYPLGLPEVAAALRGQSPGDEPYAWAGAIAARSCRPTTDQRGSAEYKRHLAGELTKRTLRRSVERIARDS
jgi:carbon-monoxide dehydrogenase medium subunit